MIEVRCPECNYLFDEDDLYNNGIEEEEISKEVQCCSCEEKLLLKIEDIDGELEVSCSVIEEEVEIEEEDE